MLTPITPITQRPARIPRSPGRPARLKRTSTPENLCTPTERHENIASLHAVPAAVLPPGSRPWCALLALAAAGLDVYAYASGGPTTGVWCIWLGSLAAVRADHNGRVTVAEFVSRTWQLLDEMGPDAAFAHLLVAELQARGTWDAAGRLRVTEAEVR